ncbi:MAG: ATP-binding protein [Alphaproteobacteria bacterium]|nr:ATP-binding protein [Alphaproteobacteria bacterium]
MARFNQILRTYLSFRWLKRMMPKSLYVRTILILVIPTLLALAVATFVFFDRHWYTTTTRLTHAVAADVGVVVELLNQAPSDEDRQAIRTLAEHKMDLTVSFKQAAKISNKERRTINPLRDLLRLALKERVNYRTHVDMRHAPDTVGIMVEVPDGLYTFTVPQRRIYTPTTEVFIGWMVGSSILLSVIALLFMRKQIRPVRRLAEAADAIGKGQDVPWFKLEGATEVRQASAALMVMRDRVRRTMAQRTAMLAGVSHDLRTPLTRMKLQLAMMPETSQTRGFQSDIADMEVMLEAYLAFARGEEAEGTSPTDIGALLTDVVETIKRQYDTVEMVAPVTNVCTSVRPNALKRCVSNLITNAVRYGNHASVSMVLRDQVVDILIDDDGPGIPEDHREDVFRPFFRLDASRNMDTGGVGLGLTIARDIARAHGGNLVLETSPEGGLRARVWIPV